MRYVHENSSSKGENREEDKWKYTRQRLIL